MVPSLSYPPFHYISPIHPESSYPPNHIASSNSSENNINNNNTKQYASESTAGCWR